MFSNRSPYVNRESLLLPTFTVQMVRFTLWRVGIGNSTISFAIHKTAPQVLRNIPPIHIADDDTAPIEMQLHNIVIEAFQAKASSSSSAGRVEIFVHAREVSTS